MSSISRLMAILAVPCLGGTPLVAQSPQGPPTGVRFEETHVATPDGVRLYVRVLGNGPDTVVIGSVAYLAQDLAPFESGRTLIFYDPRSRGGSDAVLDPTRLGMSYEVDDIEAIRTQFRIERFSLIGWSYLGAVVALYAARHPEHVQAVIQIGPMAPRASTFRNAQRVISAPDSADVAYLAQLRQAGVAASDPVRFCREYVLRQMLRPMMGRRDAATMSKADPCMYWNEWPDQVFATVRKFIPQVTGDDWDYCSGSAESDL
jgi:pimeloyl-ACP methyl ester carboxylesterase